MFNDGKIEMRTTRTNFYAKQNLQRVYNIADRYRETTESNDIKIILLVHQFY